MSISGLGASWLERNRASLRPARKNVAHGAAGVQTRGMRGDGGVQRCSVSFTADWGARQSEVVLTVADTGCWARGQPEPWLRQKCQRRMMDREAGPLGSLS